MKNSTLRNPVLKQLWEKAIFDISISIKPYLKSAPIIPRYVVHRSGSGHSIGYQYIPHFRTVLNAHRGELRKLPSVQKALNVLIDDAYLKGQIIEAHRHNVTTSQ